MSVIVKYIVVRNGVELEPAFANKKDAEAHDKLLDASEAIAELIKKGDLQVNSDPKAVDDIALFLAKNAPAVTKILKAVKPIKAASDSGKKAKTKAEPDDNKDKPTEPRARSKSKAV